MSQSKSDSFDAYVLADMVRGDHARLRALQPDSEQAQELKLLTRDHHRLGRHKTRIRNLLDRTLKEYYPRPLEVFTDVESKIALDFLTKYPTPQALSNLSRREWNRLAKREHHLGQERCEQLWAELDKPQLKVPEHVVRAKSQLLVVLVDQLKSLSEAVDSYSERVQRFFASTPAADLAKTLPGGKSGTMISMLWAELGDTKSRWVLYSFVTRVTRCCGMPPTGFPLTRSIDASGRTNIIGTNGPRDTAILKRSGLWEQSGSRLFLSCGETINRTMRTTIWRISPGKECVL